MEIISKYILKGFDLAPSKPDITNVAINFWNNVFIYEKKVIELYNISEKMRKNADIIPLSPLLSEKYGDKLMPRLISFIESIDENDTAIENANDNPVPSMYSILTIMTLYSIFPEKTFNLIQPKIDEDLQKDDKWVLLHAALLFIYSVVEGEKSKSVSDLISTHFYKMIELVSTTNVPRLRETDLYVIAQISKNYPEIISESEECDKKITSITNLFDSLINSSDKNEDKEGYLLILERYVIIIHHLSSIWRNKALESRLDIYFEKFYEILHLLFEIGIENNDKNLIQNSNEAINQLIFNSTPSLVIKKLGNLYRQTLDSLKQSKSLRYEQETLRFVQSCFCSNISTMLLKMGKNRNMNEVIKELAQPTLDILYEILDNQDNYIYEEGIMAISALINAANTPTNHILFLTPEKIKRLITEFIHNGLSSLNSGVINATCLLIGNLYYFLSSVISELFGEIPNIFKKLSIILEHKEMKDSHPFVLKAIGDIFNYIDLSKGPKPDLEEEYRELLKKNYDLSNELDISEQKDVEYGNLFYQYLTDAFCGYARIYYDKEDAQNEREQLFMLDKLSVFIYKLYPKISQSLYSSFIKTARQFADHCSRRNYVILNRHSIQRIMILAFEDAASREMKTNAKNTINYLKSI